MATAAVEVSPPRILPAEDLHPKPKRKYRKRKKRAGARRPPRVLNPAPSPNAELLRPAAEVVTVETATTSTSEARAATFQAETAAVPDRIGEVGAAPPLAGAVVESELAEAFGPDFRAIAEEYLPKAFEIVGAIFDSDHWQLSKLQSKILVPECAGCLEELYPEWKKIIGDWNLKYPRTVQFGMALSIPVVVRCLHQWKLHKEKLKAVPKAPAEYPGGQAPATPMPESRASSGSSASPPAAKPTEWEGSFTFARG